MFGHSKIKAMFSVLMVLTIGLTAIVLPGCQKKGEIKIGALLPLTGPGGKYGEYSKNGIDLAVSEINASGGINGRKVVIVYADTKASPQDGVSGLRRLIDVDGVPAVIGAMASSVTLATAPVAEENAVVIISPASSAPNLSGIGDFFFRNCVSDDYEGRVMAEYAKDSLGLMKVAILFVNNDYGRGVENVFSTDFINKGGEVVVSESFEQDANDFRTQIVKIKAVNPDAIYLIGYAEMLQALKQMKENRMSYQILSTVMFDDPDLIAKAGNTAEGVIFTSWAYDPESQEEHVRQFVEKYTKAYGGAPEVFAAQSYDAMMILAEALKAKNYTGDEIRQYLDNIERFPGVSGETTFDKQGDVMKPLVIKRIVNGQMERL